jgi:hypothetical protein
VETTRNPNLGNKDLGTYDSVCKYYPAGQEGFPNYNDASLYPCIPNTVKVGQYYVKRNSCLPNDKVGTNECSVTCGEIDYKPNGFNISPIEDPNSVLYIPVCDKVLQAGIYNKPLSSRHFYLNTFPWDIAFNLPENGVVIGKGFTIKNLIDPVTGAIDLNNFSIDPPYASPYDSDGNLITDESNIQPSSQLTVQQLEDLDNNLYTYQSCEVANQRPTCGKYYYYSRTQFTPNVGVNETTLNTKPSFDPSITTFNGLSNGQYYGTRNCYFNDYNDVFNPSIPTGRFQSPYYDFNYIPSSGTDYYSGGYNGYGIGMFGFTSDQLTCLAPSSITIPFQESPDQLNAYNVPNSNGLCLNLTSLNDLTNPPVPPSYPVPNNDLASSNCFPLDAANLQYGLLPDLLPYGQDYPPSGNNLVFNTCNAQITYEKAPVGGPGILGLCRYMPNNEDITIPATGSLAGLPNSLKQLLGFYIRMTVTDSTSSYYLSLQNTPCDCTGTDTATCSLGSEVNLNEPLGNCGGNPNNFGVGPIPTMLIYNGTTTDDLSGGTYWERPGCDSYLMNAVNALQLIISPKSRGSSGTIDILYCEILTVFQGRYNGYLSYNYDSSVSPTYAQLYHIPVKPGDIYGDDYTYFDNGTNNTDVKFAIEYDNSTSKYSIYAYSGGNYNIPVRVPLFNGTGPLDISNYLDLTSSGSVDVVLYDKPNGSLPTVDPVSAFVNSNLVPFNPYYYIPLGGTKYEESPLRIEETGGLYSNQNLYNTVIAQQNSTCSPGTQTCNLFCSH